MNWLGAGLRWRALSGEAGGLPPNPSDPASPESAPLSERDPRSLAERPARSRSESVKFAVGDEVKWLREGRGKPARVVRVGPRGFIRIEHEGRNGALKERTVTPDRLRKVAE